MAGSTPRIKKVTVCGFGLIGGSIALDLQKYGSKKIEVVAYDRKPVLAKIRRDDRFRGSTSSILRKAVAGADIVVLSATHIGNEGLLRELAGFDELTDCLIVDTGAVKLPIAELAESLKFPKGTEFLPSHPMAGKEKAGFTNSETGIFKNHTWFVDELANLSQTGRAKRDWLLKKTGSSPVYISSSLHDELVSEISHLPQLISTILGAQVKPEMIQLSGPGLKSMLRLAGSPYSVWQEIIDQNREKIVEALELYQDNIGLIVDLIRKRKSLEEVFTSAARSYKCLS